jgi:hypothetical protein
MNAHHWFIRRSGCVGLLSLVLAGAACAAALTGQATGESVQAWKQFRVAQPFQTQVIAASRPVGKSPRTLIISEPPPHVSLEAVESLLVPEGRGCTAQRWRVMAGGYVKDVVCTVAATAPDIWAAKLAKLQVLMYGTVAEGGVVALPVPARKMIAHSLDQRYSGQDMMRWIGEAGPAFRSSPIGVGLTFEQMMDSAPGVYYSAGHALVFWVLNRGQRIDSSSASIRHFAVSSDLVLGALAGKKTVAIMGRARQESLSHLPPMRSETVKLLAGSAGNALHQSYQRRDIVSGKGSDRIDRAPIYLSSQLVDTEFGTLLNIADQLLKGWSMAGQVKYVNFAYPAPRSYPFGKTPAAFVEERRGGFLFNFNTDGVAYRQTIGQFELIVPQRTGALSVIYGDVRDRPAQMEATAYDYFATSGDTSLARVVQYSFLYQIFKQFGIQASAPMVSPRHAQFAERLAAMRYTQFRSLFGEMSEQELERRLRAYWSALIGTIVGKQNTATRAVLLEGKIRPIMDLIGMLRKVERESDGDFSRALSRVVAEMEQPSTESSVQRKAADQAIIALQRFSTETQLLRVLKEDVPALRSSGAMQIAAEHQGLWDKLDPAEPDAAKWNHTAYVVQSQGSGGARVANTIGGHNINAPIVHMVASDSRQPGTVGVERLNNGDLQITHAASDQSRAGEIARLVSTRKALEPNVIEDQVAARLSSLPARAPLALTQLRTAQATTADFERLKAAESVYQTRPLNKTEAANLDVLAKEKVTAIVFEQLDDGSFVLQRTGSQEALHVTDLAAAADALAHGLLRAAGGIEPVPIYIKGVADAKAEAMIGQIQSNLRRYDKQSLNAILSMGEREAMTATRPRLMNAAIAHNGIRIERHAIKVEAVTEGAYKGFNRATIPLTVQAKVPLHWNLIFYLKDASAKAIQAITAKVDLIVAKLGGQASPKIVIAAVRAQLAADMQELGIEAVMLSTRGNIADNVNDLIISKAEKGANDG